MNLVHLFKSRMVKLDAVTPKFDSNNGFMKRMRVEGSTYAS